MAVSKKWRSLAKLLLLALIFGVCFVMLAAVIGFRSPWLGLQLMFYFMGLAKAAEPLVMLRMPRAIRAVEARQVEHGPYRWLGVRKFGELLRTTPLRLLNTSVYRVGGKRTLSALERRVESSEAIHFWAAVFFSPYIAFIWSRGFVAETIFFVFVQIAFNVYPILHLRIVRARLSAIIPRSGRRHGDA
ncbi:MAG TPA: hypothetical protein VF472_10195 [Burkholderiaceae bacterium]